MGDTDKNIEAIEEEKKEYLASKDAYPKRAREPLTRHQGGASSSSPSRSERSPSVEEEINTDGKEHPNENEIEEIVEEDKEVDIIEISFGEEEINEWIEKLKELKENKNGHIHLEIDDENELLINYEEEGEE